jgi:hypothetical protein
MNVMGHMNDGVDCCLAQLYVRPLAGIRQE